MPKTIDCNEYLKVQIYKKYIKVSVQMKLAMESDRGILNVPACSL